MLETLRYLYIDEKDVPPKLVCTSIPSDVGERVEFVGDARDGLNGMIRLQQLIRLESRPTVLTIMLSRSMRKPAKAVAATMTRSLTPVTYSRSGFGANTDGSSFASAIEGSACVEAGLGDKGLSTED